MLQKLVESIESRWRSGGRYRDGFPKWVKEYQERELGEQVEHAWQKQVCAARISAAATLITYRRSQK